MAIATLDDVDPAGLAVGVRIDVNGPLDEGESPTGDVRFRSHVETLSELLDGSAKVAIMAHQGRPGGDAFAPLAGHARRLGELLGREVGYVDAVCSSDARSAVSALEPGGAVCLENVRFFSEEPMEFAPERAGESAIVDRLAGVFDLYVNDAFAVSHRSQPSVVGFPERVASVAGRLLERELDALGDLPSTPTPRVAVLAGAKVDDSLRVLERFLREGLVRSVMVGGLVANAMFVAAGSTPGEATASDLEERGLGDTVSTARALLDRYGSRIRLPVDVAVERDGDRVEVDVEDFPLGAGEVPRDVGVDTVAEWRPALGDAGTVVVNGPVGMVEDHRFEAGTRAIFEAAGSAGYAVAGGGDTSTAIRRFGIDAFDHVSTGGGAAIELLSGRSLPGVEALDACDIDLPS